jgi:hypothetical protein
VLECRTAPTLYLGAGLAGTPPESASDRWGGSTTRPRPRALRQRLRTGPVRLDVPSTVGRPRRAGRSPASTPYLALSGIDVPIASTCLSAPVRCGRGAPTSDLACFPIQERRAKSWAHESCPIPRENRETRDSAGRRCTRRTTRERLRRACSMSQRNCPVLALTAPNERHTRPTKRPPSRNSHHYRQESIHNLKVPSTCTWNQSYCPPPSSVTTSWILVITHRTEADVA